MLRLTIIRYNDGFVYIGKEKIHAKDIRKYNFDRSLAYCVISHRIKNTKIAETIDYPIVTLIKIKDYSYRQWNSDIGNKYVELLSKN